MNMKMLFLKPPIWEIGKEQSNTTVPYGILSMITYLSHYIEKDVSFEILDLNTVPWTTYDHETLLKELNSYIMNNYFDIIGMSIMYNHVFPYIEIICDMIKGNNSETITILGGACPTVYYEKILSEIKTVDAICFSEGELPLLHLFQRENIKDCLSTHSSFITKEDLDKGKVPVPTFIEDLDTIPSINFSLIDLNKYQNKYLSIIRPVESNDDEFCLPITTTRGCPYSCIFCTANTLSGKKVRKFSAQRVIEDIIEMKEKYKINTITIEDDQFLYDKQRATLILSKIAELDLILFSNSGFTVSLIDDEIISLMRKAGLKTITLPIESGSEYVIKKIIHKPIKLSTVKEKVFKLRSNDIHCSGTIIIGLPGEKEEHRQESIAFIKDSGVDWCYIFCAKALKGSKLYDICIDNNYIDPNAMINGGYYNSEISTPDFTSEEITEKGYLINLELNFVYNNNMKRGEYENAIIYFNHVIDKIPDHAFAYYYISKCYNQMHNFELNDVYYKKFKNIISESETWKKYSEYFGVI